MPDNSVTSGSMSTANLIKMVNLATGETRWVQYSEYGTYRGQGWQDATNLSINHPELGVDTTIANSLSDADAIKILNKIIPPASIPQRTNTTPEPLPQPVMSSNYVPLIIGAIVIYFLFIK